MALVKAVVVGAVAALAIPFVMRGDSDQLGEWLRRGVVRLAVADVTLFWSWPIFAAVTLFAWGMLAWSNR